MISKWIRIRNTGFGSVSGSRSRRAKMTHKKQRKVMKVHVFWSAGCSLLRAENFSCSLDVFYGGIGISKLQVLIKTNIYIWAVQFFQCWPSEPWIRIRIHWIRIQNTAYCRERLRRIPIIWQRNPNFSALSGYQLMEAGARVGVLLGVKPGFSWPKLLKKMYTRYKCYNFLLATGLKKLQEHSSPVRTSSSSLQTIIFLFFAFIRAHLGPSGSGSGSGYTIPISSPSDLKHCIYLPFDFEHNL
jgi:hypothetical protein